MTEYSRIASGTFTTAATPVAQAVYLPFKPQTVKLRNLTAYTTPAQYSLTEAYYSSLPASPVTAMQYLSAASAPWLIAADVSATTGIATFDAGLSFQYGPQVQIVSATAANPIVFTVASGTGPAVGDIVELTGLYQTTTTGMPQICGIPFVVSAATATTFSIVWPGAGSNYTALSASPAGAYYRKVLYPFLYAPGQSFIEAITPGPSVSPTALAADLTLVTTTAPHNFVAGQEIGFSIPDSWGTTQLNTLPNAIIPGNPKYYVVTSVPSSTTFVCKVNSVGFTAFNTNQTVASVPTRQLPQVFAIGTYNTGSLPYSGGALYPSPVINGVSTINGPAIVGSFVTNTRQGFIVYPATGTVQTNAKLLTASSVYTWECTYYDYTS